MAPAPSHKKRFHTGPFINILHWHRVLDGCTSLDAVHTGWSAAAQAHGLNPGHDTQDWYDAILSFIALSPLPAPLKLGALLTGVSGFDFDLRLALGVLGGTENPCNGGWPAALADAAEL